MAFWGTWNFIAESEIRCPSPCSTLIPKMRVGVDWREYPWVGNLLHVLFCFETVSSHLGWPGTHCVAKYSLKLLPLPPLPSAGIIGLFNSELDGTKWVTSPTPSLKFLFRFQANPYWYELLPLVRDVPSQCEINLLRSCFSFIVMTENR